jgi:copper chaperone CopZ
MQTIFHVPAIHCNHCAHTIKLELNDLVGVTGVDVNVAEKQVQVTHEDSLGEEEIRTLLDDIGYPAE